jgi:mannan endo-1,4-beta-mannosidase
MGIRVPSSGGRQVRAVLLSVSILLLHHSTVFAAADPHATENAKTVLDYLKSLPAKPEKKVLSGQFVGWMYSEDSGLFPSIHQLSGKYPAVMSGNYADFGGEWGNFSSTNSLLIQHWNAGGLVEVAVHIDNPASGEWEIDTYVDLVQLITPGTALNAKWNKELDRISQGLAELRNNGIVVLFRPLLEMNGDWFWWGARDGTEFRNLWIYTFNYLTNTKNLHNLLWVYAMNANSGDTLTYYPGNQYVDVVGVDYYSSSGNFPTAYEYETLKNLGKPFALTELGQCDPSGSNCPAKDSRQIINSIKQNMPDVVYWSNWNDVWALDQHLNLNVLMSDPWVVNRGDIHLVGSPAPAAPAAPSGLKIQ